MDEPREYAEGEEYVSPPRVVPKKRSKRAIAVGVCLVALAGLSVAALAFALSTSIGERNARLEQGEAFDARLCVALPAVAIAQADALEVVVVRGANRRKASDAELASLHQQADEYRAAITDGLDALLPECDIAPEPKELP